MWGAFGYFQIGEIKLLLKRTKTVRESYGRLMMENTNIAGINKEGNMNKIKREKDKERERERDKEVVKRNDENVNQSSRFSNQNQNQTQNNQNIPIVLKQKRQKHFLSGDDVRTALRTVKEEGDMQSLSRSDGRFLFTSPFLLGVVKKIIEDMGLGGQVNLFEFYIIVLFLLIFDNF